MPKFSPGEFALMQGVNAPNCPRLNKLEGTVCQVKKFLGLPGIAGHDTDWYLVLTHDDEPVEIREIALRKLPDDYSSKDCEEFYKLINFTPQEVIREA